MVNERSSNCSLKTCRPSYEASRIGLSVAMKALRFRRS
jgi:hypothetical protein